MRTLLMLTMLFALAAPVAAQPYPTNMMERVAVAIESGDTTRMNEVIDFPALRASMIVELMAKDPLGSLLSPILINNLITPSYLGAMAKSSNFKNHAGGIRRWISVRGAGCEVGNRTGRPGPIPATRPRMRGHDI